jgi:hypothetical protein
MNLIYVSVLSRFYEKASPSRWHIAVIRRFAHLLEHEWARRLLPIAVFLHAWLAVLAKYVSERKIFRTKVVGDSIDISLAIVEMIVTLWENSLTCVFIVLSCDFWRRNEGCGKQVTLKQCKILNRFLSCMLVIRTRKTHSTEWYKSGAI